MGWSSITTSRESRNKIKSEEDIRGLEKKRGGGEEEGDKWKNKKIKIDSDEEGQN